jgi:aminoglycoside/choline kinase family phosphotransferase
LSSIDPRIASAKVFLQNSLGSEFHIDALPQDASFRRYFRITQSSKSYILMDAPPEHENLEAFIKVDQHLLSLEIDVPLIMQRDDKNGFLLLEDFGDSTFTRLLNAGEDEKLLYKTAIDTLIKLHRHPSSLSVSVPHYSSEELLREALLLVDWHYQLIYGEPPTDILRQRYVDIWMSLIHQMPEPAPSLVLRDFHVDNLMRISRHGNNYCALLDFQDALIGPMAYDLMSLIQDARRDLGAGLPQYLIEYYFSNLPLLDQDNFLSWYDFLAAQRHCKVIGIFSRLWLRDGKDQYLQHIPRVIQLLQDAFKNPQLRILQKFMDEEFPDRLSFDPKSKIL